MSDLKLFFATDIHGSEVSLRKFLNAAHFYKADVILMGGDITGKMIIPVVREAPDRFRATVFGHEYEVDSTGLPPLRKLISDAGYYVLEAEPDEEIGRAHV